MSRASVNHAGLLAATLALVAIPVSAQVPGGWSKVAVGGDGRCMGSRLEDHGRTPLPRVVARQTGTAVRRADRSCPADDAPRQPRRRRDVEVEAVRAGPHVDPKGALFVESISAEAAKALAPHARALSLRSIESLDGPDAAEVARALAMTRGSIKLPELRRITPSALQALAEKPEVDIGDFESLEIVSEGPGGLADDVALPREFLERQRRRR